MSGVPRDDAGQMAVELALLMPVIVVVALVIVNVLRFSELCARFDRVAPDAVVMHGVSASGVSGELSGVSEVREAIESAMGDMTCEVDVRVQGVSDEEGRALIDMAAGTVCYTCTLGFRPWPSSASMAGVGFELPVLVEHERSVVVDRYRPAVVA